MNATGTPLRITWHLETPWCPPELGLHLDGLIAWALVEEAKASGQTFTFDQVLADLPFDKHETPVGLVWMASLITPEGQRGSERRYLTAKTAERELATRMVDGQMEGKTLSTVDTVRGVFKNDALWYTIEHADRLTGYCVGDAERIGGLLHTITHIGKRGRLDHGRVGSHDIVEDAEALTKWRLRQMPEPMDGYVPVMGRLTPPYWQGEGATTCWRPAV